VSLASGSASDASSAVTWSAVTCTGDLNDDGMDDLVVGAPRQGDPVLAGGALYAFYGPVSEDKRLTDADAAWDGVAEGEFAAADVAGVGDLDGDGNADVMFGADGSASTSTKTGTVYLIYGPVSGVQDVTDIDAQWIGEEAGDLAAYPTGIGDVNGDGYDDMM